MYIDVKKITQLPDFDGDSPNVVYFKGGLDWWPREINGHYFVGQTDENTWQILSYDSTGKNPRFWGQYRHMVHKIDADREVLAFWDAIDEQIEHIHSWPVMAAGH